VTTITLRSLAARISKVKVKSVVLPSPAAETAVVVVETVMF
jgi:hypothetical protein